MRSARSVIAQTLGRFALGHRDPLDFEEYVRQRVEANYFAGALLAPEKAVVDMLADAKAREDISVEDLNESFYISYEMAAHRLTNLITRHLDIPVHFMRSDPDGVLWKAYENDGIVLPSDSDGTIEGQRLCRWWGSRQAFESEDSYSLHCQYTESAGGAFWCSTHLGVEQDRGDAVTVGTSAAEAHWFRGSDTTRRLFPAALTRRAACGRRGTRCAGGRGRPGRRRAITATSSPACRPTPSCSAPTPASTYRMSTRSWTGTRPPSGDLRPEPRADTLARRAVRERAWPVDLRWCAGAGSAWRPSGCWPSPSPWRWWSITAPPVS